MLRLRYHPRHALLILAVTIGVGLPVGQMPAAQAGPVSDGPVSDGPVSDGPVSDGPVSDGPVLVTQSVAQGRGASLEPVKASTSPPLKIVQDAPGRFAWPSPASLSSGYGRRWGRLHAGIDLNGSTGDPVYSSSKGVVVTAGWKGGYGRTVEIDHGEGIVTRYAHLSAVQVAVGQLVGPGELVGRVGNTGRSRGSHLHFEIRVNGEPIDPLTVLEPR